MSVLIATVDAEKWGQGLRDWAMAQQQRTCLALGRPKKDRAVKLIYTSIHKHGSGIRYENLSHDGQSLEERARSLETTSFSVVPNAEEPGGWDIPQCPLVYFEDLTM